MLFRQIRAADQALCTYLVGDIERGAAVLIDPVPSAADAVAAMLDEYQLELRAVLETNVRAGTAKVAERRFQDMVSLIGATLDIGLGRRASLPWEGLDRGGPIEPWAGAGADVTTSRVLFQWRGAVRELTPMASQVFDPLRDTLSLQFRAAALCIGGIEIEVLPVGDRPDAVAYRVEDRLATGAALWSDRSAPGGPRTGDALLELSSDLWVYPRRVGEAPHASLAEERAAWRYHHSSDRTQPPLDERGFLPLIAGHDDPPRWRAPEIGTVDPIGYRDVVPAEALVHLNSFARVVLIGDPARMDVTIPGAELLLHREAVRLASDWASDEPVLLASEMGERCRATARALIHAGHRSVYRLVGGTNLWESLGLPTETAVGHRRRA